MLLAYVTPNPVFVVLSILAVLFVLCFIFGGIVLYWYSIESIKEELSQIEKVPMHYCDRGHCFPVSQALKLADVPDMSGPVVICPICYQENMQKAKVPIGDK